MRIRFAAFVGLLAAVLLVPNVSQAALKAYKSGGLPDQDSVVGNFQLSPIFGTSNLTTLRSGNLSPSIQPSPGTPDFLEAVLDDQGGNIVAFVRYETGSDSASTLNITGFSGPGGFIFVRTNGRTTFVAGQTGAGTTTSSIDWGVITGWSVTGGLFCNSSPPFVCTFAQFMEDMTGPAVLRSSTFDIGTWTFDSAGDFDSIPWVSLTVAAGVSNTITFLSGKHFGTTLPALPIVGFGALALGLLVVGGRSLMRVKE